MNNINVFLETLPVMLYGMIGIFTVIIVIYITIALLNKFCPAKDDGE